MKSHNRLVFSAVLILIATISMMSYIEVMPASASYYFTLKATGKAYDLNHHGWVSVTLTVTGSASGKLRIEIDLYAKGGNVKVQNYGTFYVSQGSGEVVNKCHYIALYFTLTSKYDGGIKTRWCLSGRTGKLTGQVLSVSLASLYAMLPTSSHPALKYLSLTGTLTPAQ